MVVGGSMAGLCAARVLAPRFGEVVVIDRDDLPDSPRPRSRVPQGRHPHLLLHAGATILEEWFPGLTDELERAGAVDIDLSADFVWHQHGGVQRRPVTSLRGPAMSRPLLEQTVRRRVEGLPQVTIRPGTTATGVTLDDGGARVNGVLLDGGDHLPADLVVDASGRQARTLRWLEGLGYSPPEVSVVEVNTTYVSRRFRRNPDEARGWKAAAVIGDPETCRLTMALPMEDDQWIVMIGGVNGEAAPSDEVGMLAYARSFDYSLIADLMRDSVPTGPVVTHHFPTNQRRHLEKLHRFPLGWLPLGDAVCSFDPIFAQGMTSAALQARALADCLEGTAELDRAFSGSYFKAASRAVAAPWSIAVGGDFVYAGTKGKKPFGTDLFNRYTDKVVLAGQRDDVVVERFNEVISLVRPPESLLTPPFVARVLTGAWRVRRARRRDGARLTAVNGTGPKHERVRGVR